MSIATQDKPWTVLATEPSRSNPNATYELRRGGDGKLYCTCPGWRFGGKCRHLTAYLGSRKALESETMDVTETVTRTLRSRDGRVEVVTSLTDNEATDILRKSTKEFARSLIRKYAVYGNWTTDQLVWVHKLAQEETQPRQPKTEAGDYSAIVGMFEVAASKLKYPKIVFDFEDQPISLHRAGGRSKVPGSIQITDGKPYGESKWYGYIEKNGKLVPSTRMHNDILAFLKIFNQSPAAVAASYGRKEGACCFCRKPLNDPKSVAAGYGPHCAKSYGLEKEWRASGKEGGKQ